MKPFDVLLLTVEDVKRLRVKTLVSLLSDPVSKRPICYDPNLQEYLPLRPYLEAELWERRHIARASRASQPRFLSREVTK